MAVFTGNNRDNELRGTRRDDTLIGNGGDDTLNGRQGNDRLFGNAGDDVLRGGPGADRLDGGLGEDWADYRNATGAVSVNLVNRLLNTGEAAGDRFFSIERIRGSQFADTLTGNSRGNVLEGLDGGDVLDGGGGFDFARYKGAPAGVTASLENPSINSGHAAGDSYVSIEGLQGSDFADTLIGDAGRNILIGGRGADALDGRDGFDFARYHLGDVTRGVTANLANAALNRGDAAGDTYTSIEGLIGTRFRDRLTGDDQANSLRGEEGNDVLSGGLGNDTCSGGVGNEVINGGEGNDRLSGGQGRDDFVFNTGLDAAANVDLILGFTTRVDTIRLDNAVFTALGASGDLAASAFRLGTVARDASDRIIYDRATGALYYDADGTGTGAQIQFAQLSPRARLSAGDFEVF